MSPLVVSGLLQAISRIWAEMLVNLNPTIGPGTASVCSDTNEPDSQNAFISPSSSSVTA